MTSTTTYLMFNGDCEAAFLFYQSVFGGQITYMGRFSEMPKERQHDFAAEDLDKIMHVGLAISEQSTLLGSDAPKHTGGVKVGDNFFVSVNVASREEGDRLFAGLSDGGVVKMPMSDTFWQAYFGMLTDKFGVNWMINYATAEPK